MFQCLVARKKMFKAKGFFIIQAVSLVLFNQIEILTESGKSDNLNVQ